MSQTQTQTQTVWVRHCNVINGACFSLCLAHAYINIQAFFRLFLYIEKSIVHIWMAIETKPKSKLFGEVGCCETLFRIVTLDFNLRILRRSNNHENRDDISIMRGEFIYRISYQMISS
jgi:hypothetical protein